MEVVRLRQLAFGGAKLARAVAVGSGVPLSVTFHVTYQCNLRCRYCHLPRSSPELTTSEALQLIRDLAGRGMVRLGFSGGEPLLRADLGELVAAARDQGVVVSVVSNGVLLPSRLDAVRRADVLMVSLDGGPAVQDAHRGVGTFSQAMVGVRAAVEAQVPVVLVAVATSLGAGGVDELLELSVRLGVNVVFQPVIPHPDGRDDRYVLDDSDQRRLFKRLEDHKRAGMPVGNSFAHLRGVQANPRMPVAGPCPAGRFVVAVLPDGSVTACCEHHFGHRERIGDFSLANLGRDLEALRPPSCERCTSVGNLEAKRLRKLDVWAIADAWSLVVRPGRKAI